MHSDRVLLAWRLLYITYGLFPIIVGIDKFYNYLADWPIYLNPQISQLFGRNAISFMRMMGGIEIGLGILVFTHPLIGGYTSTFFLLVVVINLLSIGTFKQIINGHRITQYDTALRALAMAVGAYVLVLLTQELFFN